MRDYRPSVPRICAIAVAIGVCYAHATIGPRLAMAYFLAGAIAVVALSFRRSPLSLPKLRLKSEDVLAIAVLVLVMAPLYCWRLYTVPWQINTDEVTIMVAAQDALAVPNPDILGLSSYALLPSAVFLFVGRLGQSLGGIDLSHMRLAHGILGVACVILAYSLFRQFMQPLRAVTLAALLGGNHALFAISRMAMRENTSLLLELLALTLLARGLLRRSTAAIFLGGVATGMAFFVYFPGRITIVIGLGVLVGIAVFRPRAGLSTRLGGYAAIFLLGWAMISAPVLVASSRNSKYAYQHAREQFLFNPEGRKLQQGWIGAKSPAEAWKANIRNGLLTFNAGKIDQGNIYPNEGHGFVDPATGVLLWLGFVLTGARLLRSRSALLSDTPQAKVALGDLVAMVGFLTLFLSLAFLVNKAPNYTRLLVILPFVIYLAGDAIWRIAEWSVRGQDAQPMGGRARVTTAIAMLGVVGIVAWNLIIFRDFIVTGRKNGNDVGSTGRFVAARKNEPSYTWVLAADKTHPYYGWGEPAQWTHWMGFFAGPKQPVRVASVAELPSMEVAAPFTMFVARPVWQEVETRFRERYPRFDIVKVTPDARLLAIDVFGGK